MRVVTASGESVDLGTTETTPTIGITDFSRRVTDDFGVTTVVERDFSRRLSVRLAVPFANVDGLQQRLAGLRATAAQWIADERFAWLNVQGYYKDFSIDLNTPPISYCTLTVEGLAENGTYSDPGGDPAPDGKVSTLQLLQPVTVEGGVLASSTVAETDYPEWSASATYAQGARVIKAATHRVYESAAAANVGNDPAGASGMWIDIGPTNRWAMFDQALGTATSATTSLTVTLNAGAVTAVALLDVIASSVRVRGTGYDQTWPAGAGAVTFLDLPSTIGTVTVTITGTGKVSVGTLLIGKVVGLGVTEASPTAGITDYSRKQTDDFGEVTVVPRAWAKRMTANALIRTDALDLVASRIAAVRARPSLWIGAAGVDSLTVYGFFRDFSIEAGENVSKLALSIEGLSAAAQLTPLDASVDWPDVGDPNGTKPDDNATNGADPNSPLGPGKTVGEFLDGFDYLENTTIPFINDAVADAGTRITAARTAADAAKANADAALTKITSEVTRIDQRIDSVSASGGYDDTALTVEISRVDTASLGRDAALGTRVDTVSASIQTTDTNLRALVQTKETAAVDRENAISQRIDTILAEGGGGSDGADTIARAEISRVEQASITRDNALSTTISTVAASFTPGGNWLNNTDFVTTDGWGSNSNLTTVQFAINFAGDAYHPVGENVLSIHQDGRAGSADPYADWVATPVAVQPGTFVQFSCLANSHRANTACYLAWVNSSGQTVSYVGGGENSSTENVGTDPNNYIRSGVKAVQVPPGVVAAYLLLRKTDTYQGQSDSYAWFWRPYLGPARDGQAEWNPWSPGKGKAVQTGTDARVTQKVTALANADQAFAERAAAIEATAGNLDSRVSTTETALSDGRFATAQRVEEVAATANGYSARISATETAVSDGRFAAASTVQTLRSEYNGTAATVTQQAGTLVGLGQRTSAYWKVGADAGNGRYDITVFADANGGGGVNITGDVAVSGDLLVGGSITTGKIADGAITTALAAESLTQVSVPWTDTSTHYGIQVTIPNASGGPVRIDFRSLTGGNGQGTAPPFDVKIERVANGVATELPSTAATVGGILLDHPPANMAVTYRNKFYHEYTGGNGGSVLIYQQLFILELKK